MKKIFTGLLLAASFICQAQDYVRFEEKGKFGFRNNKGKVVIPAIYTNTLETFSQGVVGVEKAGKWGYIDTTGKLVIPCKYQEAANFSSFDIALVWFADHHGGINKKGNIVIPFIYDLIDKGMETKRGASVFEVILKGKKGIIVPWGAVSLPAVYDDLTYINTDAGGLYIVQQGKKFGVVSILNEQQIPFLYEIILHDSRNKRFKVKFKKSDAEYVYTKYSGEFIPE